MMDELFYNNKNNWSQPGPTFKICDTIIWAGHNVKDKSKKITT
jgi:hypothetical protein